MGIAYSARVRILPMIALETSRLMLRPVVASDLRVVCELGADPRVMSSLGGTLSPGQCEAWLARQLDHWLAHGYGRYWVGLGEQCVGFVGLSRADFERGIVPGVEVAWRLAFGEWGKGYATEAARAVIEQGFSSIGLAAVIGVTSVDNWRSRRVMDRLGTLHSPRETFEHPSLPEGDPLRRHVVYRLSNARRA